MIIQQLPLDASSDREITILKGQPFALWGGLESMPPGTPQCQESALALAAMFLPYIAVTQQIS